MMIFVSRLKPDFCGLEGGGIRKREEHSVAMFERFLRLKSTAQNNVQFSSHLNFRLKNLRAISRENDEFAS